MTTTCIEQHEAAKGSMDISFNKYLLSNGLTLILHADPDCPLVHVDVTYHVGSGREEVGKSGFAHFFEHMMFEGSKHIANNEHFRLISEAGGSLNGSTNRDRTNYYQTLPKSELELALWMESDRMGFLLEAVTKESFENQLNVVKNEKSQRYENQPYGMLSEVTQEHLYPSDHPYSWTTIGYTEDLDRVGIDDLMAFFQRWYGPNNAVLTIGGDIDFDETVALVEKYFGNFKSGPEVKKPIYAPAMLSISKQVSYLDKVRFPMIQFTFPTTAMFHPDEAPLDILGDILANGKNAILYQKLVKTQKAVQVYASNYCYEGSGEFRIGVFAYPGQPLEELKTVVLDTLDQLASDGISMEDVARTKVKHYSQSLYSIERMQHKVSRLASYHLFAPSTDYLSTDISRYKTLTAEMVENVFEQYIYKKPSVEIIFYDEPHQNLLPDACNPHSSQRGNLDQIANAKPMDPSSLNTSLFDRNQRPITSESSKIKLPESQPYEFDNGLKMRLAVREQSHTVSLALRFDAGSVTDGEDLIGRASFFARVFKESTQELKAENISKALEKMGASISAQAGKEHFSISVKCLSEHIDDTLELLNKLLNRSFFDEEELARNRKEHAEFLAYQEDEVDILANKAFYQQLYGASHPLAWPSSGIISTIDQLTKEELLSYKSTYLVPSNCLLVASGGFDQDDLLAKLSFLTKDWTGDKSPEVVVEKVTKPTEFKIYIKHKPGANQSEIRIGYPSIPYSNTGTFYRLGIMNFCLGSAFNSRINLNLREDKGFTYGARSYFQGGKYQGPFVATAAVAAKDTHSAVKEFLFEIKKYGEEGITEEELEFTKKSLLNSDALKYESNAQVNGFLLKSLEFGLVKETEEERKRILAKIAQEEINQLAREHLNTNQCLAVIAGDKNQIKASLESLNLGPVIDLD